MLRVSYLLKVFLTNATGVTSQAPEDSKTCLREICVYIDQSNRYQARRRALNMLQHITVLACSFVLCHVAAPLNQDPAYVSAVRQLTKQTIPCLEMTLSGKLFFFVGRSAGLIYMSNAVRSCRNA